MPSHSFPCRQPSLSFPCRQPSLSTSLPPAGATPLAGNSFRQGAAWLQVGSHQPWLTILVSCDAHLGPCLGGLNKSQNFDPCFSGSGKAHFGPFGAILGAELRSEIQRCTTGLDLLICLSIHPPEAADMFIKGCLEQQEKTVLQMWPGLADSSLNSSSRGFRCVHKGLLGALFSVLHYKACACQFVSQLILRRLQMYS